MSLKQVNEQSSAFIDISFYDEAGALVTPDTVKWSLVDQYGNIVNARDNVIITPDTTVTIILSGDDLKIDAAEKEMRYVVADATYTETDTGQTVNIKNEYQFEVVRLKKRY